MPETTDQSIWNLIRQTRSQRPMRAADNPKRAAVYGAALQQFEELMTAASTSGYAARPLPLFCAVSQAGRAIAAAWADQPWVLSGYGLKFERGKTPFGSTVRADQGTADSFSTVTSATKEGKLTEPVQLGALWASLTDLYEENLRDEHWHRPLPVRRSEEDPEAVGFYYGKYVPATVVVPFDRLPNSAIFKYDDGNDPRFSEAFAAELAHYPTAVGWIPWRPRATCLDRRLYDGWEVQIAWEAASSHVSVREAEFQKHAYERRVSDEWWLRPSLNGAGNYLGPFMTWWALLYGLSMLARYHPAEWVEALRVDKHPETVPLEAALTTALVAVPHYVLDALLDHMEERPTGCRR